MLYSVLQGLHSSCALRVCTAQRISTVLFDARCTDTCTMHSLSWLADIYAGDADAMWLCAPKDPMDGSAATEYFERILMQAGAVSFQSMQYPKTIDWTGLYTKYLVAFSNSCDAFRISLFLHGVQYVGAQLGGCLKWLVRQDSKSLFGDVLPRGILRSDNILKHITADPLIKCTNVCH